MPLLIDPAATIEELQVRLRREPALHAPHLLDVEVANALRRRILGGGLSVAHARRALRRLAVLPLVRWPHDRLLGRTLALRDRLSAYDATYVALAEHLECSLLTADGRLGRAPGIHCPITVIPH
ncbi:MAG TPA: type II toxin-antitoxin system VapC family toxin [Actinomycetes bacterium]|nr:type II toxin-antitoxin system VapC family toxin [Actinomycetes bacterium]